MAEVDTCFDALKQPAANPFAAPKQPTAKPEHAGNASAPDAPAKVTPITIAPVGRSPATAPAKANDDLIEEHTFLTVPSR